MSQERGETDPQSPESRAAAEPAGAQKGRNMPLWQRLPTACSWHTPGMGAGPHRMLGHRTSPPFLQMSVSYCTACTLSLLGTARLQRLTDVPKRFSILHCIGLILHLGKLLFHILLTAVKFELRT